MQHLVIKIPYMWHYVKVIMDVPLTGVKPVGRSSVLPLRGHSQRGRALLARSALRGAAGVSPCPPGSGRLIFVCDRRRFFSNFGFNYVHDSCKLLDTKIIMMAYLHEATL